MFYFLYLGKL